MTTSAIPTDPKTVVAGADRLAAAKLPVTVGRNVSGRSWKVRSYPRASSLVKTKINNATKSFQERQALKRQRQQAKELEQELQDQRKQEIQEKKQRRLENETRRQENALKQAQRNAQTLNAETAPSKLKAMSKKQLRQIKKTRLNPKTGVVEYVPAYSK